MVFVVDHDYKIFVANCSSSSKRVFGYFYVLLLVFGKEVLSASFDHTTIA